MGFLDIRTVIFLNLVTDFACVIVIAYLWYQNHKQYKGMSFWLADFVLQTLALAFIFLRGIVPDLVSMVLSNIMAVTGALAGYIGLQRFAGIKGRHYHNYILIVVFAVIHYYFSFTKPDLDSRNLNFSLAILLICVQCAWFILGKNAGSRREALTGAGLVYLAIALASAIRVIVIFSRPSPTNDFFESGTYDALILISYQVLLILLAYALSFAVNKSLIRQVRIQKDKFDKAFQSSPSAILITRLSDGKILEVNSGFETITGYSKEEVVGKTTPGLHLWKNDADRKKIVIELAEKTKVRDAETEFRKKSGEILVGLFSADIIIMENQQWVLSTITDISGRKQVETDQKNLLEKVERDRRALLSILEDNRLTQESLHESEARYRNLFESANVGKSLTLPTGEINVNKAFCEMLGYSADELKKKTWQELTPADETGFVNGIIGTLLSGERESARFEKRYIHKNGSFIWCDVSTVIMRDHKGNPKYFITTVVDITERKRAEDALKILNEELERRVHDRTARLETANRELEAFSYSVSHDLRAPLRHITGYVDLLNDQIGKNVSNKALYYLEVITDSAKQMGILIDDLLQFSRMARKEMHTAESDMNNLVDETIKSLRIETENRNISWKISNLPGVTGDSSMLRQVWRNLIGNAVKFTKKRIHAEIGIGHRMEGEYHVYFVSDNGAGFDMRYAGKLFGVFQRLHPRDEYEGTGIGLANVQRIISRHGGKVWAEAKPDVGATFYFSLPILINDQP